MNIPLLIRLSPTGDAGHITLIRQCRNPSPRTLLKVSALDMIRQKSWAQEALAVMDAMGYERATIFTPTSLH